MNSMSRRIFVAALPLMGVGLASVARAQGNPPASAGARLFQNVRIFDGKNSSLSVPSTVLIEGNVIERISTAPIAAEPGATVIAGGGRTLMPGLIDAHWHALLVRPTPAEAIAGDIGFNNLVAGAEATDTLAPTTPFHIRAAQALTVGSAVNMSASAGSSSCQTLFPRPRICLRSLWRGPSRS